MKVKIDYRPYLLQFRFLAGTSRGTMTEKLTYFIRIQDIDNPDKPGYGEVPFFEGLSLESRAEIETQLDLLSHVENIEEVKKFPACSSLTFGLEMALKDIENYGSCLYFPSGFTSGNSALSINGLVWMGDYGLMKKRANEKLRTGFKCIKIKIGAVNWEDEIALIKYVRERGGKDLVIRLDANGAFSSSECLGKLDQLSKFSIHSVEQPIKRNNIEDLAKICKDSPIAIALDEELIGIPINEDRSELLRYLRPRYVVLKPALSYGFTGASDWIKRAKDLDIGWWITSALESNVGLDAISQFTACVLESQGDDQNTNYQFYQGLGTGNLYTNNFPSPLELDGEKLSFRGKPEAFRNSLSLLFHQ